MDIARGSSTPVQSDDPPPTFTNTLVHIYSTVTIIVTPTTTSNTPPTPSFIAPLPVSDSPPSPSPPSLASSQSPEPTPSPRPSSPPPPAIIPPSSAAAFIEPATTRIRHLTSAITTIVVSLLLVLLALLFIWYRRKAGPNWYKLHTHFRDWRKRRREKHFVTLGKTKRRKGSIATFLGPTHGGMEYETRLEWGFPVPPEGKGDGVGRPEMVQVRIPR
ncbi:hypothetical protein EX30DRAFT_340933 [Ascodesmis nigricans]|uniref:Uncharacterized protein n=1 Tax=Ascodesmis nigricans TaxID=341454 RepID=A0A4S2MXA4_9PEZI|nr:hypothetical protein EX30DRAFT_340933 [Ascodesmis nigricans]